MSNPDASIELEATARLSLREQLAGVARYWCGATARKAVVALADQVIVSGASFFTTVLIGRICGPRELGFYSLAFAIVVLLYTVQQSVVTVPYTIYVHRLPREVRRDYSGGILAHCGLLAMASAAGLACAAVLGMLGVGPAELTPVFGVLAATVPFLLLRDFGRRLAFADLRINRAFWLDAVVVGLQLLLVGGLAVGGRLSAAAAFVAAGVSCGLVAVAWLYSVRSQFALGWNSTRQAWQQNWGFSKWVLADQTATTLNTYVMHWLLAILFGIAATGLFAACATILCVLNPIVLGLNNVLMPRVAIAIAAGSAAELRRVLWKSTLVITATTALFCGTLLLFGPRIMGLLYGAAYAGQSQTVSVLAIDMLVSSLAMAPAYALWARERSRTLFQVRVLRIAIAVVVSLCLAASLGPIAAAYGLLVGSIVATTLTCWLHYKMSAMNGTHRPLQPMGGMDAGAMESDRIASTNI
ncbi:MAG TPA: lipopolysaccharide biosynthesis protein [Pirellulales bacterium]|jgi:O-antigen/teichoic acid export membrane protein|nr:lipopolysaccharide biosynthesis protein [Pirellulales bacterium]